MNPRYLAYCRAIGMTPEQERVDVKLRGLGTSMHEFINWMRRRRREYIAFRGWVDTSYNGDFEFSLASPEGQDQYTRWLQWRAEELLLDPPPEESWGQSPSPHPYKPPPR